MSMEQHPLKSNSLKILKQVPTSKHKHQRPHNQQIPNHNQNNHREHTQTTFTKNVNTYSEIISLRIPKI